MVEILDSLQRLELKVDAIHSPLSPSSSLTSGTPVIAHPHSIQPDVYDAGNLGSIVNYGPEGPIPLRKSSRHVTAAHKVVLWPCIARLLYESSSDVARDIQYIKQDGTPWFHKLELVKHAHGLPVESYMSSTPASSASPGQNPTRPGRVHFPSLTSDIAKRYTLQYFDTFNVLYPILDKDDFWNDHLRQVMQIGFGDHDGSSVLCLLVLALGKVAEDVQSGEPMSYIQGQPSGFHGDHRGNPPGLEIFNEARKRLGFAGSPTSLENVQIILLTR